MILRIALEGDELESRRIERARPHVLHVIGQMIQVQKRGGDEEEGAGISSQVI